MPLVLRRSVNVWTQQATLPGAVIHDISFPTASVGYAAAELGQVWKTTNGGASWTEIVNVGFPYYWYGVHALSASDLVVSGFNDSSGEGIIRWSHDGGRTNGNEMGDVLLDFTLAALLVVIIVGIVSAARRGR